jgi:predicted nucleic acid-binding protein
MIGYFDTLALVPLVIAEPWSIRCAQVWQACDVRVSSVLVIAEAHAALAMAWRIGRLTEREHDAAVYLLHHRIGELGLADTTLDLAHSAAQLALVHSLRGYDAIHAAAAVALRSDDLVGITGDRALLTAWAAIGLATIDIREGPAGGPVPSTR